LAKLPADLDIAREDGVAGFTGPEGISFGIIERETDLDTTSTTWCLSVPDPDSATAGFESLGFERQGGALAIEDRELRLIGGGSGEPERPFSITSPCSSTPPTTSRARRASAGSRSPTSRTRRTRWPCSSGAPIP
jgi:hypothetical protein